MANEVCLKSYDSTLVTDIWNYLNAEYCKIFMLW